jgi:hypothetical protein
VGKQFLTAQLQLSTYGVDPMQPSMNSIPLTVPALTPPAPRIEEEMMNLKR